MFYFSSNDLEIAGDTGKGGQADGVHLPSCRDKTQGKDEKEDLLHF